MRILYWFLGAAAAMAASSYVIRRSRRDRVAAEFVKALQQGSVTIQVALAMVPPGVPAEVFRGRVGGRVFAFIAKGDPSGTHWTFALEWDGVGSQCEAVDAQAQGPEHPLQTAYLILRHHATASRGDSN